MTNTNSINNVLVAIDPTENEQHALKRAMMMNEFMEGGVNIHLFIALEFEKLYNMHDTNDFSRDGKWLNELTAPLEDGKHTVEICWSENWHLSMLDVSKRIEADIIILSDYRRKKGLTDLSSSKWSLLRDSLCPILIVDPSSKLQRKTVLAAVNMQTGNPRYAALNKKIAEISTALADNYGAQKHVVNSYEDSEDLPDRAMIIRTMDAVQENIHVKLGEPADVIADSANDIDADVVVIGTLARKGVMAALRGNKSEDIIRKLNRDVMVINS